MQHTDREATFTSWVAAHSDALYNYALNHGFDEHNSKDLVQETFISAWRNFDGFRAEASVKNWLFIILKNKIVDHFRKVCTKVAVESLQNEYNDHLFFDEQDHWRQGVYPQEWGNNADEPTARRELQNILDSCRTRLKKIQNAVFVMKYIDDLNSDQICKDLGISSSNYWVILHRAKVQLRACVEKHWLAK